MSTHKWRTRDGQEIAFHRLTDSHLWVLAHMLRKQPRMRQARLIRQELLRRGMGRYLRPSYPEL